MAITPGENVDSESQNFNPFYVALMVAVSVTLIAGSFSFWLSSQEKLNEHQLEFLFRLNDAWHIGLVAIFGLLGSKLSDRKSN